MSRDKYETAIREVRRRLPASVAKMIEDYVAELEAKIAALRASTPTERPT